MEDKKTEDQIRDDESFKLKREIGLAGVISFCVGGMIGKTTY